MHQETRAVSGLYLLLHRAPAHTDLQDYFEVSPPSVHQMLLKLEERGLITAY
ncbi:TPA: helix-turn-helix domain-containing protein [Vibrio parahaemolyticus]